MAPTDFIIYNQQPDFPLEPKNSSHCLTEASEASSSSTSKTSGCFATLSMTLGRVVYQHPSFSSKSRLDFILALG